MNTEENVPAGEFLPTVDNFLHAYMVHVPFDIILSK